MRGLFLKDLLVSRKQLFFSIFVLITYSLIYGLVGTAQVLPGFAIFFSMILNINMMAYDDKVHFTSLCLTMPFCRRDLVAQRYLMGIACLLAGGVMGMLIVFLMHFITSVDLKEILMTISMIFGFSLIYSALLLPINIRLGVDAARMASFVSMIIPFAAGMIVAKMFKQELAQFLKDLSEEWILTRGIPSLIGIALVLYGLSYLLSLRLFQQKNL